MASDDQDNQIKKKSKQHAQPVENEQLAELQTIPLPFFADLISPQAELI